MIEISGDGDDASLKISESFPLATQGEEPPDEPVRNSHKSVALLLVGLVLIAGFVVVMPSIPSLVRRGSNLFSQLMSSLTGNGGVNAQDNLNYTIYSPLIQNGAANISYPPDYGALANYALGLINSDRANYSLSQVTLSDSDVAQQHADSMLRYGYFSHNDTQGFKPYIRYTLLGGKGAVEENIATSYTTLPEFTSVASVENALKSLEWTMMYNDYQCCNNGHRYNILTGLHNQVSIGVAFNSTRVFFVEDFENYYIDLNFSVSSSYLVTMTGVTFTQGLSVNSVFIGYDSTPVPETPWQLNNGPHEYGYGTPAGGVLPPCAFTCNTFESGVTVYAQTWTFAPEMVSIAFSLHDFIQHYGSGVYTIYLITGANSSSAVTSISVFVK